MNISSNSPDPRSVASLVTGFSPLQWLKSKRISYLTIPLLIMATVTEFVILATGWKYQQTVCLPKGMGVTFFGIGPIGATILAVELLKLPLAIWTASRTSWHKGFMLVVGLPLICLLTFQLVKDMAVYEMGVALLPASQALEQASKEEVRISQLNGELAIINQKKVDRDRKLVELAARKTKATAEFDDSLKRNAESRQDAISLTDYQKKELTDVQTRETAIINQFDADAAQLTKTIADLRARREVEVARAAKWNTEDARIENAYKTKLSDYTNKKTAYEKAKTEYDNANVIKRAFMKEPIDPGVPPVREANNILKPVAIADIDAQVKAKESELLAVNNKRRDRVAQVEDDAHRLREDFDHRSTSKREESDKKREALLAAQTAMTAQWGTEEKQINQEYETAAAKADDIRTELDACSKRAEGFYEARETAIKGTQVHRIATTVEIIRGLFKGQRPVSIKATAKERGDLYTDQISMVRIWVYPVLAFIVAFLPTLMVEIGFSTIFEPEQLRPPHRLGFFGQRMHWLYTRAGRMKILRAERAAREAAGAITARDQTIKETQAALERTLAAKELELQAARELTSTIVAQHEEQLKLRESEWVTKFTDLANSLNHAVAEKDALRDLQKTEVDRQVQLRQNAWSDRLNQLRQELDDQRAASEAERATLIQDHQRKVLEISDDCQKQVVEARRQIAGAEMAAVEKSTRLSHDLTQALRSRDEAATQLKQQADSFSLKLAQAHEEAARETDKIARQEKHRLELQESDFERKLAQREEDFEQRWKQREQELSLALEARLTEEKGRVEQIAGRAEELQHQLEAQSRDASGRLKNELQQKDRVFEAKLKQHEQQWGIHAEKREIELKKQWAVDLRGHQEEWERQAESSLRAAEARMQQEAEQKEELLIAKARQREEDSAQRGKQREQELSFALEARLTEEKSKAEQITGRVTELQRQLDTQSREANTRLKNELQQKDRAFEAKLKQHEQEWIMDAEKRGTELQKQWAVDLRGHQEEWERQAELRIRATETRTREEADQKEELLLAKSRQRDQQWQLKVDAARAEAQAETKEALRRRDAETEAGLRDLEAALRREMQQKEEAAQARARQRELDLVAELSAQAEIREAAIRAEWDTQFLMKSRVAIEPLKEQLARVEKERDEAKQTATEVSREIQNLEKKLTDASSFLNGLRNGKHPVGHS